MSFTVIFPGTFDPITLGHLDIIERAAKRYSKVIIAVGVNELKQPLLAEDKRIALIEQVLAKFNNVSVQRFDGLLVDFAKRVGATCVLRGIRNTSDFDFEQQMAQMNRELAPEIDTILMLPSAKYQSISSTLVRAIARAGGDLRAFVPQAVVDAL